MQRHDRRCVHASNLSVWPMPRLTTPPGRLASAPSRLRAAPKAALPFYQTAEWKALAAAIVAQRGRRCQGCGRTGCRVFADHVTELRDGGAKLDPRNIELLCGGCHGRKTERRRRERVGLA